MRTQLIGPTFESWRDAARNLLAAGVEPNAVLWSDNPDETAVFAGEPIIPKRLRAPKVSATFLKMARSAAEHTDPRKWGLLYRLRLLNEQSPPASDEG